mgnify:CR=1 FL=1
MKTQKALSILGCRQLGDSLAHVKLSNVNYVPRCTIEAVKFLCLTRIVRSNDKNKVKPINEMTVRFLETMRLSVRLKNVEQAAKAYATCEMASSSTAEGAIFVVSSPSNVCHNLAPGRHITLRAAIFA